MRGPLLRLKAAKPHVSPTPLQLLKQHRHLFKDDVSFGEAEEVLTKNNFDLHTLAMLDGEELRNLGVKSLSLRSRILAVSEAAHTEIFVVTPAASATTALMSGPALGIVVVIVCVSVAALIVVPIMQIRSAVNSTTAQFVESVGAKK